MDSLALCVCVLARLLCFGGLYAKIEYAAMATVNCCWSHSICVGVRGWCRVWAFIKKRSENANN